MDAHALAVLEYPAIVERVARAAETPQGVGRARALVPSADAEDVARRQALTAEAIALLDAAAEPSLRGAKDVRKAATHAARGAALEPATLNDVALTVSVGLQARKALEVQCEVAPLLAEHAASIDTVLRPLADAIAKAVEEDGSDLRDGASQRLRRLRAELRTGRQRASEHVSRLARSSELREHLQEDFVTVRGGRPVLAVKASARGKVSGIVHDASSSGQTLFVEPFAVVEENNRLAEAAGAEREEVERILRELSARVGAHADALVALVEATAALDLALARGVVSRRWRGAVVEISDEIRLLGVRHPLLDLSETTGRAAEVTPPRGGTAYGAAHQAARASPGRPSETTGRAAEVTPPRKAVPIDLDLGRLRALVISGPNTGGKTVALKTLGLAAVMHQAGLRPPAAEAALPVFDQVLADIGDEQSIEMSLSTFSGHLTNLVAILHAASARSLVLVDELASGTDPVEGSALAQALLARLAGQARLTVVTTHYPELKEWASATEGVANAATGFDPETHEPLYRIALGRPGTSHALAIAERLGLDAGVVADARARVAPERLRIAELLAEAEAAERAAVELREAAGHERAEATRLTGRTREREAELEAEIERVRASAAQERERALAEAHRELAEARAELDALRKEIRAARRREQERRRAAPGAPRAERERDRRLGAASERAGRAEQKLRGLDRPLSLRAPLAPGDPVEAPALGVRGTIAAIEGDEAEVVGSGGLRIRIPLARLQAGRRGGHDAGATPEPAVRVLASARGDVSDELDVRGRRAQEAREAVRSFVDDAALAGLPLVRVVHGRGTGAVRDAVRDELTKHQLVERQEADSADGATVVHLGGS